MRILGDLLAPGAVHANLAVPTLSLPCDRSDRPRGFAVATFNSVEDADAAIQALAGCELGGRVLHARFDQFPA